MKQSKNLTTGISGNEVRDALRTSYNAAALPKLTVDWNWNRYVAPVADNIPSDSTSGFDAIAFPVSSIIEPIRPTKGIVKARVNEALVADKYQEWNNPKFYIGDDEDIYKYWTSPYPTGLDRWFPFHSDGDTTARPQVLYPKQIKTNKIIVNLETTWASPESFDIRTKPDVSAAWSDATRAENPTINPTTGQVVLYWSGTQWSSSRPAVLQTTTIAGIQMRVRTMGPGRDRQGNILNYTDVDITLGSPTFGQGFTYPTTGKLSSLNVISIAAHFEVDLTDRLMTVSDDFEMSDTSQLYPIGTITTNTADIVLSNEDGIFNPENTASPYYGLMEPNAEFNLEYQYKIGADKFSVQQFKMLSTGPWQTNDGTVSISLEDSSKYLKTIKPRPTMYENKSAPEIAWRLLDSVGFNNYQVPSLDTATNNKIPIFWTDGEQTIWEVLDTLAHDTQTAFYFDEYNILQIKTRDAAYNSTNAVSWTHRGQNVGTNLADIEEDGLTYENDFDANRVEVKYKSTTWANNTLGLPALAKVWEPDGTLVVRATQLRGTMPNNNSWPWIYIDQTEATTWPWKSKVNIDGEIIQYEGKEFFYFTGSNGTIINSALCMDADEMDTYNKKTPAEFRYKNRLSGALHVSERGVWNTVPTEHVVGDSSGWSTYQEIVNGGVGIAYGGARGFSINSPDSTARIATPANQNGPEDCFWALRGSVGSTPYTAYGTRLSFEKYGSGTNQRGGIGMYVNGGSNNGYYVELTPTKNISTKDRPGRNEVMIYSRVNGTWHLVDKGNAIAISNDRYYEVDVHVKDISGAHRISVWVNGRKVADGVADGIKVQPNSGKVALYARGKSNMAFEYIYAVAGATKEPLDDYGFYDLKYGGMRGARWMKEYVYETETRWKKVKKKKWVKETVRKNQYLFDEFGPYVHEIREFDVKLDPAPVQYSYLFNTNQWYSAIVEYTGSPFRAKFTIANTSRSNAILSGEDTLIYAGSGATVNQVCTVLGRYLDISEEETITVDNAASIRARGVIEAELSGDFIQTQAMAQNLADWISGHWGTGVDEITLSVYGNPLLQLGDVVAVDYDFYSMDPSTHKYFVTGTSNQFDQGISTTLTLRRVR